MRPFTSGLSEISTFPQKNLTVNLYSLLPYHKYTNTTYRLRSTLAFGDSTVLSGSEDGSIYAWDLLEGTVRHVLQHEPEVLASSSDANTDPKRTPAAGQRGSRKVVSAVAVCPERGRKEWASAGGDGAVVVWGVEG